ncbi:hypothetical protein ACFQ1S_08045, partial [Kibdelosporangium lantanae]
YLALTGVFAFLRLLPTSSTDKDIEILALRHQLTVLQRQVGNYPIPLPDSALVGKHLLESLEKGVAGPATPVMVNGYGAEDALQRP